MAQGYQYYPQGPGPMNPGRYPVRPGPNYNKYGEQQGWIYNPYQDIYRPDPKAQQELAYDQGLAERPESPPGLFEQLAPIAGVGAAIYGGQYLGKEVIPGLFKGGTAATGPMTSGSGLLGSAGAGTGAAAEGAGMSLAGGGTELGGFALETGSAPATGMFELGGIGSAGNVILPAVGAVGAIDLLTSDYGAGRGGLQGAASGAAIGSYFGPQGALIGGAIGGGIGLAKSFFDKPSVRERITKRWDNLSQSSDPAVANYAQQYRAYLDSDDAKNDAQEEHTFDYKKKMGTLTPHDTWGGYDIVKSTPGYFNSTEQQRFDYNKWLINNDLITSEAGDLKLKDKKKAAEGWKQVLNPQAVPPPQPQGQAPTGMLDPNQQNRR